MKTAALALVALACTPSLYSPPDTDGPDFTWEAPENDWGVSEPPSDLVAEGWHEGEVVPDFRMMDQHGQEVSLWQFYGQVIVLDHSTLWCVACQQLAAAVDETWHDYGDQGFMYLTLLSEDLEGEVPDQDELNLWADSFGITAPVLQDDAGVAATVVGDDGFPRLQVLDRDMTLAVDQVNPPTDAQLRAEIEALL